MSLLFADGFDDWVVADYAREGYTRHTPGGAAYDTNVTGRSGAASALQLNVGMDNSHMAYSRYFTGAASIGINFGLKISLMGTSSQILLQLLETTTAHLTFLWTASGLEVRKGTQAGTLLGTIAAGSLPPISTWNSISVFVTISDTVGVVTFKINGVTLLNLTSVDTQNGGTSVVNRFQIGSTISNGSNNLHTWVFDDLIVWDTTGTTLNADPGDIRVDTLLPNGAGSFTQMTPSAGANYACVDDASANTTDYVSSNTSGNKDLYNLADMPINPANIFGIYASALVTKDDAGSRSAKLKFKSGATSVDSSTLAVSFGSWTRVGEPKSTDPNTSAAWTKAAIDALELGVEVA